MRTQFSVICLPLLVFLLTLGLVPFHTAAALEGGAERDMRALGAAADGETDDTGHFVQALEAIGDSTATLVLAGGIFAVESLVFPSNVTLAFRDGGQLAVATGHEIEINGRIDAGIHPIFSGPGIVAGNVQNLHVFPQWFGAVGDGRHDDARALQQAADLAAGAMGRTLFVPEGEYLFTRDIAFRCNVENRGLFVIELEIDEDRTTFCNDLFLPTHHPKRAPNLRFVPDHAEQELDIEPFYGIREGDVTLPAYREVPLADGSGHVDLEEGGVLRFYSSDFFSSRAVRKGAHYYDKNDICQIVSGRGAVFPEFAFDYSAPPDAEPWSEEAVYTKADYCSLDGEIFKATWPSGEGTSFRHRHLGEVEIGPVPPNPGSASTNHNFTYEDGTRDSILLWRRVGTRVWYRRKDIPTTVNGLRIEVRLLDHGGETKRISAGAATVSRSNMTFNNLEISVRDREATMSRLLQSSGCVNVEFNNSYFSGATSAHLGYNILNSNVANFRYNHCISTNARKGMDGRHGKNIYVTGGYYSIIDDHYGRNYVIRDVTLSGLSVHVPGDSTPQADLQAWRFSPRTALAFNGANFYLQNITVIGGRGGIMGARGDIGDFYGNVVLRDVTVRDNDGDVRLFNHSIREGFDYAHDVKVPTRLTIDNITLENPGGVRLVLGSGFGERPYGTVNVRNVPIMGVFSASPSTNFTECTFLGCDFTVTENARINFRHCMFEGENTGLEAANVGIATGNAAHKDAECSFPISYVNTADYSE